jgi:hypothetical protein
MTRARTLAGITLVNINAQTGTSYTFALTDASNTLVTLTNAAADYPIDGNLYQWDEEITNWKRI